MVSHIYRGKRRSWGSIRSLIQKIIWMEASYLIKLRQSHLIITIKKSFLIISKCSMRKLSSLIMKQSGTYLIWIRADLIKNGLFSQILKPTRPLWIKERVWLKPKLTNIGIKLLVIQTNGRIKWLISTNYQKKCWIRFKIKIEKSLNTLRRFIFWITTMMKVNKRKSFPIILDVRVSFSLIIF